MTHEIPGIFQRITIHGATPLYQVWYVTGLYRFIDEDDHIPKRWMYVAKFSRRGKYIGSEPYYGNCQYQLFPESLESISQRITILRDFFTLLYHSDKYKRSIGWI